VDGVARLSTSIHRRRSLITIQRCSCTQRPPPLDLRRWALRTGPDADLRVDGASPPAVIPAVHSPYDDGYGFSLCFLLLMRKREEI
jgi:hypothetical protein